jgi:hypothetical protein
MLYWLVFIVLLSCQSVAAHSQHAVSRSEQHDSTLRAAYCDATIDAIRSRGAVAEPVLLRQVRYDRYVKIRVLMLNPGADIFVPLMAVRNLAQRDVEDHWWNMNANACATPCTNSAEFSDCVHKCVSADNPIRGNIFRCVHLADDLPF